MPLRDLSHSSLFFLYHRFLSLPTGQTYTLIPVLICICLITNKVGHLLCIFIICIYSFVNCYSCPQSIFPYWNISYSLVRKPSTLGVFIFPLCVSKIFFSLWFWFAFQSQNCIFFPQRDLLHLYNSNLAIFFKVVFSWTFFEILIHGYPHSAGGGPPTSRHHFFFSSLCPLNCMQKGLSSNAYLIQSLHVPLQNPNLSSLSVFFLWERHAEWHWFCFLMVAGYIHILTYQSPSSHCQRTPLC